VLHVYTIFGINLEVTQWIVLLDRQAAKDLKKLPKEIVELLDQLRNDLMAEGPTPKGWTVKHVKGRPSVLAAKLKREYRALYEVVSPSIIIISVSHRKEAY
jgi:mRNA-degrading endonuclease RelE of RelBE toxin-antitoxin system